MSLGKPNLYLGGTLIAGGTTGAQAALAGISIKWGDASRIEFAPPATLSGSVLILSGAMPSWANGTQVGLVDPVSGRCLFAGHISSLSAAYDTSIKSAVRVSFTATSPLADLKNHSLYEFEWTWGDQAHRFNQLSTSIARGWALTGYNGSLFNWITAGRLKFQSKNWLELCELYCRSIRARYHDTSAYVPGSGFVKRLTLTDEREKTAPNPPGAGIIDGEWYTGSKPTNATGIASLPSQIIDRGIEWEKNPDDTITDLKLSTFGIRGTAADDGSFSTDYWMSAYGYNNQAMQDLYGFRQLSLETDLDTGASASAVAGWIEQLAMYWLDADTKWRPQAITIPNGNKVKTAAMLNLLAVDTRHMACVYVPPGPDLMPGKIHAYVNAGEASWDGKKWTATLTLGRTFD